MLFLLCIALTFADMPPDSCDTEACSVERLQQEGTNCQACDGSASGAKITCAEKFAGSDFVYVCQTDGISQWSEVWCDGPPTEDTAGAICTETGCQRGCSESGAETGVWMAGLALLVRRSRSPKKIHKWMQYLHE
jgi:hypothetical protein